MLQKYQSAVLPSANSFLYTSHIPRLLIFCLQLLLTWMLLWFLTITRYNCLPTAAALSLCAYLQYKQPLMTAPSCPVYLPSAPGPMGQPHLQQQHPLSACQVPDCSAHVKPQLQAYCRDSVSDMFAECIKQQLAL